MHEIESGSVLDMVPESAASLLAEINGKHSRIRLSMVAFIVGALVVAVLLLASLKSIAAGGVVLTVFAMIVGSYLDKIRRSVVLLYDFEPDVLERYQGFVASFERLIGTDSIWHVAAEGNDRNWKRNGGATRIQNRSNIRLALSSPGVVKSNIDVPSIPVGKQVLHFFPDRILVVDNAKVGAVEYGELQLDVQSTRFVEDGRVPSDARVVGHTWLHPNRNGGPDRRFRDNRQIPICAYDEGHFSSRSGLNELVQISAEGRLATFAAELRRLVSSRGEHAGRTGRSD
ncbi:MULTISPECIES: hypothetical protein [unclassified Mesorhizobium]|uniref:hypothetical protein n=1 Tax=unclassified Mesorhizobium TaxID=325217 RepID=UPI001FED82D7|nr:MULTISPECIES: hypothetical protein [unclassified Mesorhizobium]